MCIRDRLSAELLTQREAQLLLSACSDGALAEVEMCIRDRRLPLGKAERRATAQIHAGFCAGIVVVGDAPLDGFALKLREHHHNLRHDRTGRRVVQRDALSDRLETVSYTHLPAVVFTDDKGILAQGITEDSARAFAEDIASRAALAGNLRGSADYRREICKVLVRRAAMALGKEG